MPSGGISGEKHPVLVQSQFCCIPGEIIQRGGAVAEFVADIQGAVVEAVLQKDDVIAFF